MILPGHTVGYGDIEIEGEAISAVNLKDRTFEHSEHSNIQVSLARRLLAFLLIVLAILLALI